MEHTRFFFQKNTQYLKKKITLQGKDVRATCAGVPMGQRVEPTVA